MESLFYAAAYFKFTYLAFLCSVGGFLACLGAVIATIRHKDNWKAFCIIAATSLICLTLVIFYYRDHILAKPIDLRLTVQVKTDSPTHKNPPNGHSHAAGF